MSRSSLTPEKMRSTRTAALIGAAVAVGSLFLAAWHYQPRGIGPFTPSSDDEVVERLTRAAADPRTLELRRLRQALADSPLDVVTAANVARAEIEEARATSDPRHLGYAQSALQPWWGKPDPPPAILILRATIRQSRHDFPGALADLNRAVELVPEDPQPWLTRSVVLTVLARYAEAARSCEPLWRLTSPVVAEVCRSSVDALTGRVSESVDRLQRALALVSPRDPVRPWALSVLAEATAWSGDRQGAERLARAALAVAPDDSYTRAQLVDLLLDLGRAADVPELLVGREANDGLLLRLALAETAIGGARAAAHVAEVGARFDAARMRGDSLHGREEARFELAIRHDAKRALALAAANWQVQHEPADARILLEAAAAAAQPGAAAAALEWVSRTHFQDPTIRGLAARLNEEVAK